MRTDIVNTCADAMQFSIYKDFNAFGGKSPVLSRVLALPVAVLDVAIDTFKTYLSAIEHVALAVINLIGAVFSKKYTLKDALVSAELALISSAMVPVKSMLAMPKIIFQCIAILIHPSKAQSINARQATFKNEPIDLYVVNKPTFSHDYSVHTI